jgi:hypothetical protein
MRRFSESTRCRTVRPSRLVSVSLGATALASPERSQVFIERLTRKGGR